MSWGRDTTAGFSGPLESQAVGRLPGDYGLAYPKKIKFGTERVPNATAAAIHIARARVPAAAIAIAAD